MFFSFKFPLTYRILQTVYHPSSFVFFLFLILALYFSLLSLLCMPISPYLSSSKCFPMNILILHHAFSQSLSHPCINFLHVLLFLQPFPLYSIFILPVFSRQDFLLLIYSRRLYSVPVIIIEYLFCRASNTPEFFLLLERSFKGHHTKNHCLLTKTLCLALLSVKTSISHLSQSTAKCY
jgi:hypothetical protein